MSEHEGFAAKISQMLAGYVSDELLVDGTTVDVDQNLLVDGVVDSLGMLRLVGFIEASFDIKISADQLTIENFRNIRAISQYVARLLDSMEK